MSIRLMFKKCFIEKILSGEKDVTRRLKEPRFKMFGIVDACTNYYDKPFAKLEIQGISKGMIDDVPYYASKLDQDKEAYNKEARREGFDTWEEFLEVYKSINKAEDAVSKECYRIEFKVVNIKD